MIHASKIKVAILSSVVISLTVAACQPQVLPYPANALTPAEVAELFIGKTALGHCPRQAGGQLPFPLTERQNSK